jgi:hypothetical protein
MTAASALDGSSRLFQLVSQLEKIILKECAFNVSAKDSINFGVLVTNRQKWVPVNYQVGDLVSTMPLAQFAFRNCCMPRTRSIDQHKRNLLPVIRTT